MPYTGETTLVVNSHEIIHAVDIHYLKYWLHSFNVTTLKFTSNTSVENLSKDIFATHVFPLVNRFGLYLYFFI